MAKAAVTGSLSGSRARQPRGGAGPGKDQGGGPGQRDELNGEWFEHLRAQ